MTPAPFWKRLFLLPFSPRLWAEARGWSVGQVLLPILLLSLLLGVGLGLYRGFDLGHTLREGAAKYDHDFDPVVFENGELRVEGARLPHFEEGSQQFLVDPEETVTEASLEGKQYVLVRKKVLIDNRNGFRRETKIGDVLSVLDIHQLRIDGASINAFADRYAGTVMGVILALIVFFSLLGDLILLPLYALAAGAVLASVKGKALGLTSQATFRICLATLAARPVLATALALAGTGLNACLGLFLWPAFAVGLGLLALQRVPPTSAPPVAAPPPST